MIKLFSKLAGRLNSGSKRTANIKKNILGTLLLKGVSIAVQLMLVPMTLNYLSTELYGVWLTVSSIILSLSFFDIGLSLGLKNRLAEAIAKNDYETGRQLVSTTYVFLCFIFIPLGVIMESVMPLIHWSHLLNVSESLNSTLVDVMQIITIAFVLQMIFNTIGTIVAAFQKVALSNAFPVIGNAISLVVIWFLTRYTEPSLKYMAWTISYIPILVFIVSSIILFNGRLKAIRPSFSSFNIHRVKDLFSLGIKFFVLQIQMLILQQATNFLISNISNPDYVSYYNIAYRYIGTAQMILVLILGPFWPAFTEAYVKKDFDWMKSIYRKLCKLYICVFFAIIFMAVVSPVVYSIWIGNSTHIPKAMTWTLTVYFIISAWNAIQAYLINGIGILRLSTYVTLVGMSVHIPLSYFLGQYIGAYGVIASLAAITLFYTTFFTTQLRKILNKTATGIWLQA